MDPFRSGRPTWSGPARTPIRPARPPRGTSRALWFSTALVILVPACGGGAAARLERGIEQEARGEPIQAALLYISALERDASLTEARERLEELAPTLVERWGTEMDRLLDADEVLVAAERTLVLTQVIARAPGVGVPVPLGVDWPDRRSLIMAEAVSKSLRQARNEGEAGRWGDGIRTLERALERYEPSRSRADELDELRTRHLISWARFDLEAGRPRAAFLRLGDAGDRLQPSDPLLREVGELQARALEVGSLSVAFLPLASTDRAAQGAPGGFRETLNELLQLEHWTLPPPFLITASPVDVRREADRIRLENARRGRSIRITDDAAELGRALGTHRVVVTELESFARDTTNIRLQERAVPVKGGGTASYRSRTGTVRLAATVGFLIVDPRTRRTIEQRSFTLRTATSLQDALYDGDPEALDLSARERLLFTRAEQEAREGRAGEELQDLVAGRLADELFGRLVSAIP